MWKPEQLLQGKDFDPVFAHAIVRKFPELDDILWDRCYVKVETIEVGYSSRKDYLHFLELDYRFETVANLYAPDGYVQEESFYKYIMGS